MTPAKVRVAVEEKFNQISHIVELIPLIGKYNLKIPSYTFENNSESYNGNLLQTSKTLYKIGESEFVSFTIDTEDNELGNIVPSGTVYKAMTLRYYKINIYHQKGQNVDTERYPAYWTVTQNNNVYYNRIVTIDGVTSLYSASTPPSGNEFYPSNIAPISNGFYGDNASDKMFLVSVSLISILNSSSNVNATHIYAPAVIFKKNQKWKIGILEGMLTGSENNLRPSVQLKISLDGNTLYYIKDNTLYYITLSTIQEKTSVAESEFIVILSAQSIYLRPTTIPYTSIFTEILPSEYGSLLGSPSPIGVINGYAVSVKAGHTLTSPFAIFSKRLAGSGKQIYYSSDTPSTVICKYQDKDAIYILTVSAKPSIPWRFNKTASINTDNVGHDFSSCRLYKVSGPTAILVRTFSIFNTICLSITPSSSFVNTATKDYIIVGRPLIGSIYDSKSNSYYANNHQTNMLAVINKRTGQFIRNIEVPFSSYVGVRISTMANILILKNSDSQKNLISTAQVYQKNWIEIINLDNDERYLLFGCPADIQPAFYDDDNKILRLFSESSIGTYSMISHHYYETNTGIKLEHPLASRVSI